MHLKRLLKNQGYSQNLYRLRSKRVKMAAISVVCVSTEVLTSEWISEMRETFGKQEDGLHANKVFVQDRKENNKWKIIPTRSKRNKVGGCGLNTFGLLQEQVAVWGTQGKKIVSGCIEREEWASMPLGRRKLNLQDLVTHTRTKRGKLLLYQVVPLYV